MLLQKFFIALTLLQKFSKIQGKNSTFAWNKVSRFLFRPKIKTKEKMKNRKMEIFYSKNDWVFCCQVMDLSVIETKSLSFFNI